MMNGNFLVIVHLSLPKSEKILFLLILLNYLASNLILLIIPSFSVIVYS